jgi:hypothetical protein
LKCYCFRELFGKSSYGEGDAASDKAAPEVEGILFKSSKNSDGLGVRGIGIFDYEFHNVVNLLSRCNEAEAEAIPSTGETLPQ